MAITSAATLGATQSKTANQSSIAHVTTGAVNAGHSAFVAIAVDNHETTDADHGEVSSVIDSDGNTYVKLREFTNGQGAAQAGCTISAWIATRLPSTLGVGSTITANFTNSASRDAAAITAWEFISDTPLHVVAATESAVDAAAINSLDVTTPNVETLRVRVWAHESASTVVTPTTDWTGLTLQTTSGGGGATNIGVKGEFRIITATTEASAPSGGGSVDTASVYVALMESVTGTGALVAQSSTMDGAGTVGAAPITGTGAMQAQSAAMAGAGTSSSAGTGALAAQSAAMAGAGVSESSGSGALESQESTVAGSGIVGDAVMGIPFIATASSDVVNTTTSLTITIPTVQVDDLLVLALTNRDATTTPTVEDNDGGTWTRKTSATSKGSLWYRRATSETSSKIITADGFTGSCSGQLIVLRGVQNAGDPFDQYSLEDNASGNESHAELAPSQDGSYVGLAIHNVANDNPVTLTSATNPGALTDGGEHRSGGGNDCGTSLTGLAQATAAATGIFTWTQANGITVSQAFVIAPASAAIIGAGTLQAQSAMITGAGVTMSIGSGAMAAGLATLSGFDVQPANDNAAYLIIARRRGRR